MKLIKVKGIVIREVAYKENDKIITILTDTLGKVSAVAKGSKKTNSPFLASSQYLVYSEFVLYQNKSFYYVNSASVINTFYNLRIDFDKLQIVFDLTKILNSVTDENQDLTKILQLFLNTIYMLDKSLKDNKLIIGAFKIKLFTLLGFTPRVDSCNECNENLLQLPENFAIYYNYIDNTFFCENCKDKIEKKKRIELNKSTFQAIVFVMRTDIKKIFSFELKNYMEFELFGQVYSELMMNH